MRISAHPLSRQSVATAGRFYSIQALSLHRLFPASNLTLEPSIHPSFLSLCPSSVTLQIPPQCLSTHYPFFFFLNPLPHMPSCHPVLSLVPLLIAIFLYQML